MLRSSGSRSAAGGSRTHKPRRAPDVGLSAAEHQRTADRPTIVSTKPWTAASDASARVVAEDAVELRLRLRELPFRLFQLVECLPCAPLHAATLLRHLVGRLPYETTSGS